MAAQSFLQKHLWIKHLLYMIVVSVVLLIVTSQLIKLYARQGQEYTLPEVVGLTIEQLSDDNPLELNYVIIDSVYRRDEGGGVIIAQNPKPGTKVKKARKVYLTITAYSAEMVTMSELTDMSLRQAVSQLENDGLQVGQLTFVPSPYRNAVLEQSCQGKNVRKGDKVARGTTIDLTVGLGESSSTSIVPFVIGKSVSQAHRDIHRASLNVGREHFNGVRDRATAVVVKQQPAYNGVNRYQFGTSVELWYDDANKIDVDKMVRDFRVDSSTIEQPQSNNEAEDYLSW